jgi:hypothetical protein
MSKPNRVVHFHPKHQSWSVEILGLVDDFNIKGENVIQGDRNAIKRFDLNGKSINIKSFKAPKAINAFIYKFIRKSKAKRSFEYAEKLLSLDILTPFPVAYIEEFSIFGLKKSYYISEHIDFDFDFRALIHNPKFPDRENILTQFTKFTFKLHENRVNFLDHSPGNTLIVKKANNTYDFYLIDLNRMRFETMNFNKRMHNFRRLWLSKAMLKIIAEAYAKLSNKTYQETHDVMLRYSRRFQRKIDSKKLRRAGRKPKFKN